MLTYRGQRFQHLEVNIKELLLRFLHILRKQSLMVQVMSVINVVNVFSNESEFFAKPDNSYF